MASGKLKEMWPIWVIVVVAAVFIILALRKEKAAQPEAPAQDVIAENSGTGSSDTGIKPRHGEDAVTDNAMKPHSAIVVPPQQVVPKDAFAIQVYSFKDKNRADMALEKLRQKGYKAYIMISDLGARGLWYRVRVGTFPNEQEAQKALESITNDFKSGIIVSE